MRRTVLTFLLVIIVSTGIGAHEGMIALVADPAMLDCDDGIEPGTLTNLYLYYLRGGDGPYNIGAIQFKFLLSSEDVWVLDPDWVPGAFGFGDVTEGIAVCINDDNDYCGRDQVFFGTIPIYNFDDSDTFTVTIDYPMFNGPPAGIVIVSCANPDTETPVSGNSYTFNGKCRKKDDSPIVLGADAIDPRTVAISFNEEVTAESASRLSSYMLIRATEPDAMIPLADADIVADGSSVELRLAEDLVELGDYSLFVDGVSDLDGNPVIPGEPFSYALFTAPAVATMLHTSSASVSAGAVTVRWELSAYDEGDPFIVTRSGDDGDLEMRDIEISRDGLEFSFTDASVEPGAEYIYRVDVVTEGERMTLFATEPLGVPVSPLALYQNSPNPFNPATTIGYCLPVAGEVSITVFDVSGRRIRELASGMQPAGEHSVTWNGSTDTGARAAAGIYFYMLEYGKESLTRKMVLLR